MNNTVIDLTSLTEEFEGTPDLSLGSSNLINDLAGQINQTMAPVDLTADVPSSMFLNLFFHDNSWSMEYASNWISTLTARNLIPAALIKYGVDPLSEVLDFLLNQNQQYVRTVTGDRTLNEFQWTTLAAAPSLVVPKRAEDYLAGSGTPLYGRARVALGSLLARTLYHEQQGINVRSVTCIQGDGLSTEGYDEDALANECLTLVTDLHRTKKHRIIFMGVGGPNDAEAFKRAARKMGVKEHNIMLVSNNPDAIAEAWIRVSTLSAQVSQTSGSVDDVQL